MAAAFTYRLIPVQRRPLLGADGRPLTDTSGHSIGDVAPGSGFIAHWYDGALYQGWVAEARRQFAQAIALGSRPTRDAFDALGRACQAIAQAYNAANVPWTIDPQARLLLREFIAGQPSSSNPSSADFGQRNYNTNFAATNYFRVLTGVQFGGAIPQAGRAVQAACLTDPSAASRHAGQFLQTFGLTLDVATNYQGSSSSPGLSLDPRPDFTIETAPALQNFAYIQAPLGLGFCRRQPGCVRCGSEENSAFLWDAYWFDSTWVALFGEEAPLRFAAAPRDYAPWIDRWIAALEQRPAEALIQDARSYAIFRNDWSANAWGGAANYLRSIGMTEQQLNTPSAQTSAELAAVAAAAAAVGAALSGATGGVSVLIGGGVAGVLSVVRNYVPPDVSTLFLDDVQRMKPIFERGWLAGSPASGADGNRPDLVISDPPGWTRPGAVGSLHPLPPSQIGPLSRGLLPAPVRTAPGGLLRSAAPSPWIVGGALALAAGGLYLALRPPRGTRPGRKARR